jgi:hypothetical protein
LPTTSSIFLRTAGFARRTAFGWGFFEDATAESAHVRTRTTTVKREITTARRRLEASRSRIEGSRSGIEPSRSRTMGPRRFPTPSRWLLDPSNRWISASRRKSAALGRFPVTGSDPETLLVMKGLQAGAFRAGRLLRFPPRTCPIIPKKSLNNAEEILFNQKSIDAVTTYKSLLGSFSLAGVPSTPAKLQAVFQADIDSTNELDAAEANVANLRSKQKAARAASRHLHANLKKYLVAVSGPEIVQIMQDFGYPALKTRTQTVASKAHQVAQAKATRAAKGKKGGTQTATTEVVTPAPSPTK